VLKDEDVSMIPLGWQTLAVAIARNQAHRLFGGPVRGGHRIADWPLDQRRRHAKSIFDVVAPHIGSLEGAVGLEIGPGDNLDVCVLCMEAGAKRMYAVEKFARGSTGASGIRLIPSEIEHVRLPEQVDFAFSHDVLMHVNDVAGTMRSVYSWLKPGGRFVNSTDLRGQNAFSIPDRPLDYLTCPDWLWNLMFSHIFTTNRVRASAFVTAAVEAGFRVTVSEPLVAASPDYVRRLKPHMLPRYQSLEDDDLAILQLLLVLEKPAGRVAAVDRPAAATPDGEAMKELSVSTSARS
jgi:SAM-dependent methyltransferase